MSFGGFVVTTNHVYQLSSARRAIHADFRKFRRAVPHLPGASGASRARARVRSSRRLGHGIREILKTDRNYRAYVARNAGAAAVEGVFGVVNLTGPSKYFLVFLFGIRPLSAYWVSSWKHGGRLWRACQIVGPGSPRLVAPG